MINSYECELNRYIGIFFEIALLSQMLGAPANDASWQLLDTSISDFISPGIALITERGEFCHALLNPSFQEWGLNVWNSTERQDE